MNRILSFLLVLTILASIVNAIPFNENTSIETSDLGAQIIDTLGHTSIETQGNWGDLLAVFYVVVLCLLILTPLLAIAIIMIKRRKGQ